MLPNSSFVKLFTALAFLLSLIIFSGIFYLNIPTDLQDHIFGLQLIIKHHSFPVPPLYYFLVYLFSGCSLNTYQLYNAAILLLSVSVALKYYYSTKLISNVNPLQRQDKRLMFILWLLIFAAPMAYDYRQMFIGRISTNVWHNSTTIFLMPFAILMFDKTICFFKLKQATIKDAIPIILFAFINVLIKPSFLFPFIPSFVGIVYLNSGFKSSVFKMAVLISMLLCIFIFIEYYAVYKMAIIDAVRFANDTKGIEIKPFYTLLILNNGSWVSLFLNLFASLLFPLICFIIIRKQIQHNIIVRFTILLFVFSLLIGILISEKGIMASNGNFIWQLYISNYLLFLVLIKYAYDYVIAVGWRNKKSLLIIISFGIHVVSGLLYLAKIFYLKKYT